MRGGGRADEDDPNADDELLGATLDTLEGVRRSMEEVAMEVATPRGREGYGGLTVLPSKEVAVDHSSPPRAPWWDPGPGGKRRGGGRGGERISAPSLVPLFFLGKANEQIYPNSYFFQAFPSRVPPELQSLPASYFLVLRSSFRMVFFFRFPSTTVFCAVRGVAFAFVHWPCWWWCSLLSLVVFFVVLVGVLVGQGVRKNSLGAPCLFGRQHKVG